MRPSASTTTPPAAWISSELIDVRPARREAHAPHLAIWRLRAQRLHEPAGLLPVRPEQDRRPGARDRGAEGAERRGRLDQLHRTRVERAPARLVQGVG